MHAITALIPVKNGEEFLPEFLETISKVCTDLDEILFINDGSIDQSPRILQEFCSQNDSRKVVDNPGQGLVDALNFGVGIAQHDWIARFDVDDCYEDFRLEIQRKLIDDSVSAIFCDYQFQSDNGKNFGSLFSGIAKEMNVISLVNNWRTPHPGVLFNRKHFFAVKGYQKEEYPVEDLGLWLRIKDIGALVSCPEILFKYRLNPNSISAKNQEIMHAKKTDLLKRHNNLHSYLPVFESKLYEIYDEYSKYPKKHERRLLLLFDYATILKVNNVPLVRRKLLLLVCIRLFTNPNVLIAFAGLVRHKVSRDRYRSKSFKR
jgi:glycosyltransferase involved in cell wall biosynthesis